MKLNNDPVNNMNVLLSGLIIDFNKAINNKGCFVIECSGLSKSIFVSLTRQILESCLCSQGQAAVH